MMLLFKYIPLILYFIVIVVLGVLLNLFWNNNFIVKTKQVQYRRFLRSSIILLMTIAGGYGMLFIIRGISPSKSSVSITDIQRTVNTKRILIKGLVDPPTSTVNLLVHPENTGTWWVQPYPVINRYNGRWDCVCYLGTDSQGVGTRFDIIAIASNTNWFLSALQNRYLIRGETIKRLPLGNKSDIVVVRREK